MTFDPFNILWGLGWFVALTLLAGIVFAHKDRLEAYEKENSPHDMPWWVLLTICVPVMVAIWPAVLAIEIGWMTRQLFRRLRDK